MAEKTEQESASEQAEQVGQQSAGDRECLPCRGTGKVISKLGGEEHAVDCPWCEGSGQRIEGMDAQAHWPAQRGEAAGEPAAANGDGGS